MSKAAELAAGQSFINPCAFLVRPTSNQANIGVGGSATTVVFGTEVLDLGGNFASNAFTAPITGSYQLNVFLRLEAVDSAAAYYHAVIVTSNRSYDLMFDPDFGQDAAFFNLSGSVLADMGASDTASITIFQSGGTSQTDINTSSTFSGFRVS